MCFLQANIGLKEHCGWLAGCDCPSDIIIIIITLQSYEVLYKAVKGKHWSKIHWCFWQAAPLRVQEILSSWLKRMMSRRIPHRVLVFYCPTERDDNFEGSASFKPYFMSVRMCVMHISMTSCKLWHFCLRYHPLLMFRPFCYREKHFFFNKGFNRTNAVVELEALR